MGFDLLSILTGNESHKLSTRTSREPHSHSKFKLKDDMSHARMGTSASLVGLSVALRMLEYTLPSCTLCVFFLLSSLCAVARLLPSHHMPFLRCGASPARFASRTTMPRPQRTGLDSPTYRCALRLRSLSGGPCSARSHSSDGATNQPRHGASR
jgi:hypothetical protein